MPRNAKQPQRLDELDDLLEAAVAVAPAAAPVRAGKRRVRKIVEMIVEAIPAPPENPFLGRKLDIPQSIIDATRSQAKDQWTKGLCMGGIYSVDGTKFRDSSTSCHAWIGAAYRTPYNYSTATYGKADTPRIIANLNPNCGRIGEVATYIREANRRYTDWLLTLPISHHILNRDDPDEVFHLGMFLYHDGKEKNNYSEHLWLCKAMRYMVEHPTAVIVWDRLVRDGGVHPLFAHYVSHYFSGNSRNVEKDTISHTHVAVWSDYKRDAKTFKTLFDMVPNPKPAEGETKNVWIHDFGGGYYPPDVFCGGRSNQQMSSSIMPGLVKAAEVDDGWGGKIKSVSNDWDTFIANVKVVEAELKKG